MGADAPTDLEDLWTDGVAGHLGSSVRDCEPVVVPLEPGSAGHCIRQVSFDLGPSELRLVTARHLPPEGGRKHLASKAHAEHADSCLVGCTDHLDLLAYPGTDGVGVGDRPR